MLGQLKSYGWQIVSAALLALAVWSLLQGYWLRADLATARLYAAQRDTLVAELNASIAQQNSKIEALEVERVERNKRLDLALRLADTRSKDLKQVLERAQAAKASTCADAMPVLNDMLRSLK